MLNAITLVGNLGQDPEFREGDEGRQDRATLSVATSRRWKDRDDEPREETTWFRVTVWGGQARACREFLAKGRQVLVQGRMRHYDDENKRRRWELVADRVLFLGKRPDTAGGEWNKGKSSETDTRGYPVRDGRGRR